MSRITFYLSCLCRSQYTFRISDGDQTSPTGAWGSYHRRFLVLMMGAPEYLKMPPRRSAVNVFYVDVGRSRISVNTSQRSAIDVS
jgi:hypothetical protein